jgi:hypothetical protein
VASTLGSRCLTSVIIVRKRFPSRLSTGATFLLSRSVDILILGFTQLSISFAVSFAIRDVFFLRFKIAFIVVYITPRLSGFKVILIAFLAFMKVSVG